MGKQRDRESWRQSILWRHSALFSASQTWYHTHDANERIWYSSTELTWIFL